MNIEGQNTTVCIHRPNVELGGACDILNPITRRFKRFTFHHKPPETLVYDDNGDSINLFQCAHVESKNKSWIILHMKNGTYTTIAPFDFVTWELYLPQWVSFTRQIPIWQISLEIINSPQSWGLKKTPTGEWESLYFVLQKKTTIALEYYHEYAAKKTDPLGIISMIDVRVKRTSNVLLINDAACVISFETWRLAQKWERVLQNLKPPKSPNGSRRATPQRRQSIGEYEEPIYEQLMSIIEQLNAAKSVDE